MVGNHPRKPRYQGEGGERASPSNTSEHKGVLMLPATVSKRVEARADISKPGKRINGLFRLMETPDVWRQA